MGRGLDNSIKFATIEDNATVDQTGSELATEYEANADTNAFNDSAQTKLDAIVSTVTWTTAILGNSWAEYSTSWGPPAYLKDSSGTVFIRGLVKSGTIGATIFTLPVGYRPTHGRKLTMSISNNVYARLDITVDGTVIPVNGSNVWFSISCSFKTD